MKFGEKVKALRKERGLTQNELAKAVGVGTRSVVGWEQEGRYPASVSCMRSWQRCSAQKKTTLLTEDEQFVSVASSSMVAVESGRPNSL